MYRTKTASKSPQNTAALLLVSLHHTSIGTLSQKDCEGQHRAGAQLSTPSSFSLSPVIVSRALRKKWIRQVLYVCVILMMKKMTSYFVTAKRCEQTLLPVTIDKSWIIVIWFFVTVNKLIKIRVRLKIKVWPRTTC